MRKFDGIPAFQAFLQAFLADQAAKSVLHKRAEKAGQEIVADAKARLGSYQEGWAPLKPSTVAHKSHGDTPLLETGRMRDSIGYEVTPISAHTVQVTVGSTEPRALAQELGTSKIPPRPFLQPAVLKVAKKVGAELAQDTIKRLKGEQL